MQSEIRCGTCIGQRFLGIIWACRIGIIPRLTISISISMWIPIQQRKQRYLGFIFVTYISISCACASQLIKVQCPGMSLCSSLFSFFPSACNEVYDTHETWIGFQLLCSTFLSLSLSLSLNSPSWCVSFLQNVKHIRTPHSLTHHPITPTPTRTPLPTPHTNINTGRAENLPSCLIDRRSF